jgi:hypothetical protein
MDYDKSPISGVYDLTGRKPRNFMRKGWWPRMPVYTHNIAGLGCNTGRYSEALHSISVLKSQPLIHHCAC